MDKQIYKQEKINTIKISISNAIYFLKILLLLLIFPSVYKYINVYGLENVSYSYYCNGVSPHD